jgi:DNA mismatch endonuclease, patch repair protein
MSGSPGQKGISPERRSQMMASVKKKNTKPEVIVRRFLHNHGLRYTLHDGKLPGTPDIVFPSRHTVLFIHGCYWHRCPHCAVGSQEIRSNASYWLPKLARNQARDAATQAQLAADGWAVIVVWECQVSDHNLLYDIVSRIKSIPKISRS